MKKCVITAVSIILSFAFCFACVGYAQLADTLTITGKAEAKPPEGIYITSVALGSKGSGISSETSSFEFPTTVNTSATISNSTSNTNRNNRTVTYKITVYNNTAYKYVYKGIEGSINSNLTITTKNKASDTSQTFVPEEATVAPGETITFYATYKYGTANSLANQTITSSLNYKFGIHIDSLGDMALDRILIRFREILNTQDDYEYLIEHIDDKFVNQEWQSNYIGNVHGASNSDTKVVETLFGDSLSLTIDGVTKNVTILIKRENIDNNTSTGDRYGVKYPNDRNMTYYSGCEMTLYMTANDLDRVVDPGERNSRDEAEVYVAVFTCQAASDGSPAGDWYLIGDVYEGYSNIVSYDGVAGGTGSFVTDNWLSTAKTYQVTSNYSYNISAGVGIKKIIPTTDRNAVSEYTRLKNIAQKELNYINANADYFNEEVFLEPIAKLESVYQTASAMNVNNNTYRAHVVRILKDLENAVYPFLSYVGEK